MLGGAGGRPGLPSAPPALGAAWVQRGGGGTIGAGEGATRPSPLGAQAGRRVLRPVGASNTEGSSVVGVCVVRCALCIP